MHLITHQGKVLFSRGSGDKCVVKLSHKRHLFIPKQKPTMESGGYNIMLAIWHLNAIHNTGIGLFLLFWPSLQMVIHAIPFLTVITWLQGIITARGRYIIPRTLLSPLCTPSPRIPKQRFPRPPRLYLTKRHAARYTQCGITQSTIQHHSFQPHANFCTTLPHVNALRRSLTRHNLFGPRSSRKLAVHMKRRGRHVARIRFATPPYLAGSYSCFAPGASRVT